MASLLRPSMHLCGGEQGMACGNVQSMRWQCVSLATGKCSGNDGAEACTIGTAMRSGIERGRKGGGD
jgi:hypothetical protein